ncbi:MAG: baseplate J/gp47 family protein [Pseudomonadota bacterium]|nr:baseplate J/gp47 family protein [Pseudomonadota bacterium]
MAGRSTIDLSRLPLPDALAPLDFEALWAEIAADIIADAPEAAPALALKSEMMVRAGRAFAYRLLLKVNEINAGVRAVMPALATGADLDQLGVIVGIQRLVIDAGDPAQGVGPTYESDDAFRQRFILAPEGYSVAGPAGAYEFHALSASGQVLDASAVSPSPGEVLVTVLARSGDGTASPALLATVEAVVNADAVRPLTDYVQVQSATIKPFAIEAVIRTYSGPDPLVVMAAADKAVKAYVAEAHRLGRDINLSALYAALTVPGVMRVDLVQPTANIVCNETQAAFCTGVSLTHGGLDD